MKKNILVLTGSPRKNGNSSMLADAFTEGAKEAGHEVNVFEAALSNVSGCTACMACWKKDSTKCAIDDDFTNTLAPLLEKTDVLVFCMPLYFYGFPAQIKAAIDRMFFYKNPSALRQIDIKESALLICCTDKTEDSFSAAYENYRLINEYLKMEGIGIVGVTGVSRKGDVKDTDGLERARMLGKGV